MKAVGDLLTKRDPVRSADHYAARHQVWLIDPAHYKVHPFENFNTARQGTASGCVNVWVSPVAVVIISFPSRRIQDFQSWEGSEEKIG